MTKKDFKRIECSSIKLGMRFSAPVFFDDGENMFHAEGKTAKMYHIAALKRWAIPFLLTFGHPIDESDISDEDADEAEELEEVEELDDLEDAEEVEELDDAEELEELEEIEELPPVTAKIPDDDAAIRAIIPPKKEYSPSNDTYFATENFAHVENLFAEELKLGSEIQVDKVAKAKPLNITIYDMPSIPQPEMEQEVEEEIAAEAPAATEAVEELAEEDPQLLSEADFSMTSFGDNVAEDVPELESALAIPKGPDDAIVEEDGVFSISENLEYTNVIQDPDFKELVDSIL